jgi:predicted flavoprotein YhiN
MQPTNCGFDVGWSDHFRQRFAGQPVKPVVLARGDDHRQGEFVVTENGVEGSLIDAVSARLRDAIAARGQATLHLDLLGFKKALPAFLTSGPQLEPNPNTWPVTHPW